MDPAKLEDVFRERPALHRFPANMARRTQELAAAMARDYDGDAGRIWREAKSGKDLEQRLLALPGIGEMKAKTLIAIIGKRLGVKPPGWEEVAPDSSHARRRRFARDAGRIPGRQARAEGRHAREAQMTNGCKSRAIGTGEANIGEFG